MNALFVFISKGYEFFIDFGLFLLVLVGVFFLFKRPRYAYYLTVFTVPFKSLYIWMGTNIEVWKLMSAMSLCLYGPRFLLDVSHKLRKNPSATRLTLFVLYAIFITIVIPFTIPDTDKQVMEGGFFKNEGRIIFQIVFFLITINLILWPSYILKNVQQAFYTFRVIVLSVITLSVAGLIQLVSLNTTGYDPFPIHRVHGLDNTGGLIAVQGFGSVQRLNSLAGEPKHFAIALIIGFLILIIHRLNNVRIISHEIMFMGMFFVCLVATYSTTGYLWFGVTIISIFALYRQKFTGSSLLLVLLAALSLSVANLGTGGGSDAYIDKTINKTGLEIQDEAVLGYLKDNPLEAITGLGLGNIHHYAVHYIPLCFPLFRKTPFKGNTGLFLLLGDVGLIGIILLTLFITKLIFKKFNKNKTQTIGKERQDALTHIIIISYALFMMRYFELFYVFLGISLYCSTTTNKKQIY